MIIARNTCSTCALHVGAGNALFCRARPPTAVPIIGPDPKNPQQPALIGQFSIFPKVEPDWWCGEFRGVGVAHGETMNGLSIAGTG